MGKTNPVVDLVALAGTQEALAAATGVTQSCVSRWVSLGYVPVRHLETIKKLYGVDPRKLVSPNLEQTARRVWG